MHESLTLPQIIHLSPFQVMGKQLKYLCAVLVMELEIHSMLLAETSKSVRSKDKQAFGNLLRSLTIM